MMVVCGCVGNVHAASAWKTLPPRHAGVLTSVWLLLRWQREKTVSAQDNESSIYRSEYSLCWCCSATNSTPPLLLFTAQQTATTSAFQFCWMHYILQTHRHRAQCCTLPNLPHLSPLSHGFAPFVCIGKCTHRRRFKQPPFKKIDFCLFISCCFIILMEYIFALVTEAFPKNF